MGGEPGLQFGVDAVDQGAPVAPVDGTAFLGGHGLAGDLGHHAVAGDAQVVGRFLGEAGEFDGEAPVPVQRGAAQQVPQRDQGRVAGQALGEPGAQAGARDGGQGAGQAHRILGIGEDAAFGRAGTGGRAGVGGAGKGEFKRVALLRGPPGKRPGLGALRERGEAGRPGPPADQAHEG